MWILAYFLLHFAIYTAFRLQFLIWNWSGLKILSTPQILSAFFNGFRFDLSALAFTVGLFYLGLFWIEKYKPIKKIWFGLFWLINSILFLVNSVDSELVNFTARRFTKASFFLVGEGNVTNLIIPYIWMAGFTFLLLVFYAFANVVLYKKIRIHFSIPKKIILSFVTILLAIVCSRGGLQHKPMTFVDGRIFENPLANHMVFNSTFTLFKSLGKPTAQRIHYFDNKEMLGYLNQPEKIKLITPAPLPKANVVIFILESFSKEYTELKNPEFTPFLNSLAKKGLYFPHFYANSRRSIEGVAAILAGVPALMEEPFISSEFASNEFIGLGTVLSRQGYHTSFFHGANNGSMHFDAFTKSAGIQNYYGRNEYPDKNDDDGTWGIYDGPFLNWACEKFSTFPQPFMSSLFTLSSHQPFNIPAAERAQHPDGPHPILKSIHYTDSTLQRFMECAENTTWYKNTIFIFTADHTGPRLGEDKDFSAQFEVPLVIYSPNPDALKNMDTTQFGQHIDILPTLLETIGIEQKSVNHLARSLWHTGPKVIPLYSDGIYDLQGFPKGVSPAVKANTQKAVIQYFSEGLFDNKLYYPLKSSF
ncbi:MAG: LTA synthase family protein [Bdellovibrio sp.]|nr:LTA synthase family protein [Bdellovibrio sp.]